MLEQSNTIYCVNIVTSTVLVYVQLELVENICVLADNLKMVVAGNTEIGPILHICTLLDGYYAEWVRDKHSHNGWSRVRVGGVCGILECSGCS